MSQHPEAKPYYNHIFSCRSCRAPIASYCPEGFRLWAEYQVPSRAASILDEPDIRRRRAMLQAAPAALRDMVGDEVKRQWRARQAESENAR